VYPHVCFSVAGAEIIVKKKVIHCFCVWALMLAPAAVRGQLIVPLGFGNEEGIVDEYGNLLPGTAMNPGTLIQLLRANDGIHPPGLDGTPHTNNPVLIEVYMGNGTDINAGPLGLFAGQLEINRSEVNLIFARIFNGTNLASSSFFAHSQIYQPPLDEFGYFVVSASQTSIQLDPADDDNDGLSNSWEKSLGSNPLVPDTDGDGISDYHEFLAGTKLLDVNDYLQMVELIKIAGNDMLVQWSSVPGKNYLVEYATNNLREAGIQYLAPFVPIAAVTNEASLIFTNGALLENPHFRVRLVPDIDE